MSRRVVLFACLLVVAALAGCSVNTSMGAESSTQPTAVTAAPGAGDAAPGGADLPEARVGLRINATAGEVWLPLAAWTLEPGRLILARPYDGDDAFLSHFADYTHDRAWRLVSGDDTLTVHAVRVLATHVEADASGTTERVIIEIAA